MIVGSFCLTVTFTGSLGLYLQLEKMKNINIRFSTISNEIYRDYIYYKLLKKQNVLKIMLFKNWTTSYNYRH